MQSRPIGKPDPLVEDIPLPGSLKGSVRPRLIRPRGSKQPLPVVMSWWGSILGDASTHDRLAREPARGVRATIALVEFSRSPESHFPIAIEEAYAATKCVAENSVVLNRDGSRLAIVGDSTGGNIAPAVTLLFKERQGPRINFQVLFYPVTDANFETASYGSFAGGPCLIGEPWNVLGMLIRNVITATPVNATIDQLRGLPDALAVTAESDVLRDEGEACARKLWEAGVRATCSRYLGTIHDFVMLNAIADTPAARGAIAQAITALREALE
jgi:acetyl esterase